MNVAKAYDACSPGFGLADLVIPYQQSGRLEEARRTAERPMTARRDFTIASWVNTQFHRDAAQLAAEIEAPRLQSSAGCLPASQEPARAWFSGR